MFVRPSSGRPPFVWLVVGLLLGAAIVHFFLRPPVDPDASQPLFKPTQCPPQRECPRCPDVDERDCDCPECPPLRDCPDKKCPEAHCPECEDCSKMSASNSVAVGECSRRPQQPPFEQPSRLVVSIYQTITEPSFLMAGYGPTTTCPNAPSWSLYDKRYFAPVETSIFYTILKGQCDNDDFRRNPLVVDVGANLGYFTNYAASFGCRVKAFEPIPVLNRHIAYSAALNGVLDRVDRHEAGVGSAKGTAKIAENCQDNGLSTIGEGPNAFEIKIEALDDEVKEDVILLKIDVEGYEDEVFRGMRQLVKDYRVQNIVSETKSRRGQDYKRAFINDMIDAGYAVYSYKEQYGKPAAIWDNLVKQTVDPQQANMRKVKKLGPGEWIPYEDLWFTLNPPANLPK